MSQQNEVARGKLVGERVAAVRLGISERTLQKWRVEGKGPGFHKLGRRVLYSLETLDEFVATSRRASTSDSGDPASHSNG